MADPSYYSALAKIRIRYAEHLSQAIAVLEKFSDLCEHAGAPTELIREVAAATHKLSGNGQTFGFLEISTAAITLENILDTAPSTAGHAARTLAKACKNAVHAIELEPAGSESGETLYLPVCLAIHDDPSLRDLLAGALSSDAQVRTVSSHSDAMAAICGGDVKLVIADLDNPACQGEALADFYREAKFREIAVLGLASNRRSTIVAHAVSGGEILCLTKPIEADQFREKATAALKRQHPVVVLCDDDRIVRELLRVRFEARGFVVVLANDGEEVIAQALRHGPDIIVLDWAMPKLDGISALRMLKADPATHSIPVVMLTAKSGPEQITQGKQLGASAYILKPFSPDGVVLKCRTILSDMRGKN